MFTIYSSLNPKVAVEDDFILENRTYFILLDSPDSAEVSDFFSRSELKAHLSWHHGNKIAELCIKNFIGKIRFFDREIDVRSEKFDSGMTGAEQIKVIVDELDELSRKMSFSYSSALYNHAEKDWESVENNLVHRLNYIYQIFFEYEQFEQAGYQLEKIKRNTSLKYEVSVRETPIWKLRKISPSTVRQLAKVGFSGGNEAASHRVHYEESVLSSNTLENQFVKFFYEYCQQICLSVLNIKKLPDAVVERANSLLLTIRRILSDSFFIDIDSPSRISTNSTVLSSRDGYNNLLKYFTNSLFSVRHIFEEFENELKVDLVDIATLYEMWCFYKVSYQILGEQVFVSEKTSKIKEDTIKYSTTFENDNFAVSYNRSFSISGGGSYSTTLRPDITVQNKATGVFFHFDAKYRINSYIGSDDLEYKTFKNDDVNKMHAYLDAIYDSDSAIVLYPGNKFKFFVNSKPSQVVEEVESEFDLTGVGALPLIPGADNTSFSRFLLNRFS
ncbi:DUF2357 domain-containing protein [Aestuariicella sp. G3-2]|uniref:DUF2357 domain-containing protein n=1 Tax=Pseudomaricurvus albidus TaxID=2842452 RepID=UPI001C0BC294|nr:DUF2357 domain-containing protein [Aestuariicella albida]MBU3069270.1 DUF2357 domain-containing protein [Aestuariicella albida]